MTEITTDQHKIIDTAFKLFAKNGQENTTMAQIAKDLGYSRTFLYYYFPDKESIFKMALVRCANKYFDALGKEIKKSTPGIKKLENAIQTKIHCAKDFQVIGVYSNPVLHKMLREHADLIHILPTEQKLLTQIINVGKKDGSIKPCKSADTSRMITDGLNAYISFGLQKLIMDGKHNRENINELFLRQNKFGLFMTNSIKK